MHKVSDHGQNAPSDLYLVVFRIQDVIQLQQVSQQRLDEGFVQERVGEHSDGSDYLPQEEGVEDIHLGLDVGDQQVFALLFV